jgi:hypothetical protein
MACPAHAVYSLLMVGQRGQKLESGDAFVFGRLQRPDLDAVASTRCREKLQCRVRVHAVDGAD